MTEAEREALVERVALDAVNRARAKWNIGPIDSMARTSPEEQREYREDARAALAVIEPAVREDDRSCQDRAELVHRGCICPAGAEATCQGWNCPRRPLPQGSAT